MFKSLQTNRIFNKFLILIFSILYVFNRSKRQYIRGKYKNIYKNHQLNRIANIIQENYKDYYCIFTRNGIGDIFFVASLIKEFKNLYGGKFVFFTEKKSLVPFLKAFPSIDAISYDKNYRILQEYQTLQKHITIGQLNKLFFPYRGTKETYTFSDNYNNLLYLPLDAKRELPIVGMKNLDAAQKEFFRLRLYPEKTILIIPDATMFDYRIIHAEFWINIASELEKRGYQVVFNTKLKEFKNFTTTFLPIMDFVAFAQKIKYVISFRSGINDLFCGMGITNISVLYPPNLEVIWADAIDFHKLHNYHTFTSDNELENMFNIHSLNKTFKTDEVQEIIYDFDDVAIQNEIISNIEKGIRGNSV